MDCDRYEGIVFPEYYEDIFSEGDLDFRFKLIRQHIHPKLRCLLTGCLDLVADLLETDPFTFSTWKKGPKSNGSSEDRDARFRCALYALRPNEVRGNGYPKLRGSSGRSSRIADFDLGFFCDREGLGLELHIGRREELALLADVHESHPDEVQALLTFIRLGVDGPSEARLLSLTGMIEQAKNSEENWLAIFEPRYPFPIAARDFMGRFEDCFLALYVLYDAMLSRALGISDHFLDHFAKLDEHYSAASRIEEAEEDPEPPLFE